jgi:hypothetical protein
MQIAGAIGRGKIRSLVLRAPFDQFHLFIALDEPVHDRKQEAYRGRSLDRFGGRKPYAEVTRTVPAGPFSPYDVCRDNSCAGFIPLVTVSASLTLRYVNPESVLTSQDRHKVRAPEHARFHKSLESRAKASPQ